jgi:integrase/recombinase XerD
MHSSSPVCIEGPLEPYAAGFDAELARLGFTPDSAYGQLRLAAQLSSWLAASGVVLAMLNAERVEGFLAARRAAGCSRGRTGRALGPLLGYLRGLGVVPPSLAPVPVTPAETLLARYRAYLISERGLTERTCRIYAELAGPFLASRSGAGTGGLDLESLAAGDVIAFVVQVSRTRPAKTTQRTATALRSLLRFLHVEGLVPVALAAAIPPVASWKLAGLPRGLEPAQVQALLAACDLRTAAGLRDFAVLTVLARLGLRAGEVAGLLLEDIGWRRGEIVIRGKGSRHDQIPLPPDAGQAIAGYLRSARPATAAGRHVFIRTRAPHCGLTPTGVTQIVAAAGRRAGVGPVRAHRLRNTAATGMLRAGAPLSEIGQLLRHASPMTTALYAKVDTEALRALARPWPAASASGAA